VVGQLNVGAAKEIIFRAAQPIQIEIPHRYLKGVGNKLAEDAREGKDFVDPHGVESLQLLA
jgi:hypothetical protein